MGISGGAGGGDVGTFADARAGEAGVYGGRAGLVSDVLAGRFHLWRVSEAVRVVGREHAKLFESGGEAGGEDPGGGCPGRAPPGNARGLGKKSISGWGVLSPCHEIFSLCLGLA